jgi:hypothetical protein
VVCLPADRILNILPIAEELSNKDAQFSDALREGHTFTTAASRLQHL